MSNNLMIAKKGNNNEANYQQEIQSLLGERVKTTRTKNIQKIFVGDRAYEIINSKVRFQDMIQGSQLKTEIKFLIDEYLHKEILNKYNMKADNKILLYGPSGCGKTMAALALANKLNKKLFLVNLSTIVNSSLGKTSTNIFEVVENASIQNGIIFFDEFDSLAKMRNDENDHGEIKRIASAIIQVMDFLDENTILIAATNHMSLVDDAILRRFGKKIKFDLPSEKNIESYLKKLIKPTNLTMSQTVIKALSKKLAGLSFAEVRDKFFEKLKRYIILEGAKNNKHIKSVNPKILNI